MTIPARLASSKVSTLIRQMRSSLIDKLHGWQLRATYGLMAVGALFLGLRYGQRVVLRDLACLGVVLATAVALVVSVQRKAAGVAGERDRV